MQFNRQQGGQPTALQPKTKSVGKLYAIKTALAKGRTDEIWKTEKVPKP